jgi:hypothetical protein
MQDDSRQLLMVMLTIAAVLTGGCSATQKGNSRTFAPFPPSANAPAEKSLLAFEGKVDFNWTWPGSLQGRAQDLVEEVGYFQWTNAEEAADYKLVVNVRRYPHVPSAVEWLEAILSGLTFTLSPTFTETDTYELNAELLSRAQASTGAAKSSHRLEAYRLRQNYHVVIQLFFLLTPNRWYLRARGDDAQLIDTMLKDVLVWAHEVVQKERAAGRAWPTNTLHPTAATSRFRRDCGARFGSGV